MNLFERLQKLKPSDIWENKIFLYLLSGLTVCQMSDEITLLALSTLAINKFGATADKIGFLKTVQTLPYLFFGFLTGAIVDRFDPVKIMVVSNIICFFSILSIPIAYQCEILNMNFLYIVMAILGTFTVFYTTSGMSYIPMILNKNHLANGNSKTSLSKSGTKIFGPVFAGWLIEFISTIGSIFVNAVSYLISFFLLLRIKRKPVNNNNNNINFKKIISEIIEGLKFVFTDPILRFLAIVTSLINLGYSMMNSILLIFAYNKLHFSPKEIGFVLAISSMGLFVGASIAKKVSKKIGLGKCLFLTNLILGLALSIIPVCLLISPIYILTLILFLIAFITPIFDINQLTLRQLITPVEIQGRMNANMRTIIWGTIPIGSFLGGIIAVNLGYINTFIISGLTVMSGSLLLFICPVYKIKDIKV
jgi:MFS family permease